jgi:hypothetical protein
MPTPPPPSSALPLEYAPAPLRWRKRVRFILLMLFLIGSAFCAWRWGPYAWHQSKLLYWQRRCINFSQSPDIAVYEEDPAAAATLLKDSSYSPYPLNRVKDPNDQSHRVTAAVFIPLCWNKLSALNVNPPPFPANSIAGSPEAIIFLHERTSPAGHHRLVGVNYGPEATTFQPAFLEGYNYYTFAGTPATWTKPITFARRFFVIDIISGFPIHPPLVRIYAGQPDPNDSSHFTIRYQIWGQEDVLDGRLGDDDQVTLTPRHSPQWPRE